MSLPTRPLLFTLPLKTHVPETNETETNPRTALRPKPARHSLEQCPYHSLVSISHLIFLCPTMERLAVPGLTLPSKQRLEVPSQEVWTALDPPELRARLWMEKNWEKDQIS